MLRYIPREQEYFYEDAAYRRDCPARFVTDAENAAPSNKLLLTVLRAPAVAEPTGQQHTFPALLVKLTSTVYCFLSAVSQPVMECPDELLNVYHGCLSYYSDMIAELKSVQECRTSMVFTQ